MKSIAIRKLLAAMCAVLLLTACEEKIDLNLDQEQFSRLVVEGWIKDNTETQTIRLTRTAPYDSNAPCPPVTGANVTVTAGEKVVVFYETRPGVYQASDFRGEPGTTYHLSIHHQNNHYTAASTMPVAFPIDSVKATRFHFGMPADIPHYQLLVYGQEDPAPGQFYIFQHAKNGQWNDTMTSWSFLSDFAINGQYLKGAPMNIIESESEEFTVQLRSLAVEQEYLMFIDQCFYSYMPDMFFSPPPATVTGNISGGALGYFAATSVSTSQPLVVRKRDHFTQ